jgi:hypothetical protein
MDYAITSHKFNSYTLFLGFLANLRRNVPTTEAKADKSMCRMPGEKTKGNCKFPDSGAEDYQLLIKRIPQYQLPLTCLKP